MPTSDRALQETAAPIRYWDRRRGELADETVYGGGALRWLYGSRLGRLLAHGVLARPWVSRIAGKWYSHPRSRRGIARFVERFGIDLEEYEPEDWGSFNEFFVRQFRSGARRFTGAPDEFPAFAEGRYLAWERVDSELEVPVKGAFLAARALLGRENDARPFEGGALVIARLCPVDYHRFHYPDSGRTLETWEIGRRLHSVNPWALLARGDILATNQRRVSLLETEHFGRLAYVEVGAMNVGRIVQTHDEKQPFARGDEKGYFLFGGSTVLVLAEPGRLTFDADLLERTQRGVETLCRLGERVGRSAPE